MKYLLKLLVVFLLIIGCDIDDSVEDPIETCSFENGDIEWLNLIIDDLEKSNTANKTEIYQYTYKEETVFLINDCVNCSDALEVVYNCSGEVICEFGGIAGLNTCVDFDTATNKTLIWTNANNQVIIDNEYYNNTLTEGYQISNVYVEGDILKFSISASGCSGGSWQVNLIDADVVLESLPVQRNLKIDFENNEACLAFFTKEYEIDISSLQVNGEEIVHFNLEGWSETIVYNYGEASTIEKLLLGNWSNVVYDGEIIRFDKVAELPENKYGFTFKEEFPTCIERTSEGVSDAYLLPSFYDLERTYTLEGDNLKIYDIYITAVEGAQPILLHDFTIVSIDENELLLDSIESDDEFSLEGKTYVYESLTECEGLNLCQNYYPLSFHSDLVSVLSLDIMELLEYSIEGKKVTIKTLFNTERVFMLNDDNTQLLEGNNIYYLKD